MLLIPDSLTDYQTMKDMSTQLLKRRSGALITGEGKYVFLQRRSKMEQENGNICTGEGNIVAGLVDGRTDGHERLNKRSSRT